MFYEFQLHAKHSKSCIVREKSKKMEVFQDSMKRIKGDNPTEWLSLNKAKLIGTFIDIPERNQVEEPFNEQLVIELYSK